MNIEWNAGLSVNNRRIDCEHQFYFDLLNALHEAHIQDSSKERMVRLLDEFVLFVRFHFKTEENLMLDTHYSEYDMHTTIHSVFLNDIKFKVDDFVHDVVDVTDILDFITNWFLMHISQQDKIFGAYLLTSQHQVLS